MEEIGITDAQELIALASPDQCRFFLDMELWKGDSFIPEKAWEWFGYLMELGEEHVAKLLPELDHELLLLFLTQEITVGGGIGDLINDEERLTEWVMGQGDAVCANNATEATLPCDLGERPTALADGSKMAEQNIIVVPLRVQGEVVGSLNLIRVGGPEVHDAICAGGVGHVELFVDSGMLTIRGEKKGEKEERGYSERFFGRFERQIPLPTSVDEQHCKAEFHDGLLTIHLPKSREAEERSETVRRKG